MSLLHSIVLGVLQGLGEFLPISSSAHLIVFPWLLGWPEHELAFDVALHVGTLLAVVVAFWRDWVTLLASALRGALRGNPFGEPGGRLLGLLILASVPGAVVGLLLDKWAETTFRSPEIVALFLGVMGSVLLVVDSRDLGKRGMQDMSVRDALLVGASQALAILPGVSRSGATISMALYLGYSREESARFSFLMSTPIILGAALVKVPALLRSGDASGTLWGMAAAAVFGLISIKLLLGYVRTRSYAPFVYYRWALSIFVLAVILVRYSHLG